MRSPRNGVIRFAIFSVVLGLNGLVSAQERVLPEILEQWRDWATWDVKHRDCPIPHNGTDEPICFWPSGLSIVAQSTGGTWTMDVTVFERTWVPLPGNADVWPLTVRAGDKSIAVVEHGGAPSVQLAKGIHRLTGSFVWDVMPQRIAIPPQIGILTLVVDGQAVAMPNWDANGDVWLKRVRGETADKDDVGVQIYRVLEDGIPLWLRTELELTVSGKSREEELGWILPDGWKLSLVDSPIPVAVDERGQLKAQVRAGKWTIRVDAFRVSDAGSIQFAPDARPVTNVELVAFAAKPEFRIAELQGMPPVDVTQTTFPEKWRDLPIYQWDTTQPFQLVEKMRGMGEQRPAGLSIARQLWLDEDGRGLTYRDQITGQMQQIWRLDAAEGHELGAVRIDGEGQLITANPATDAHGVEIRTRNLDLDALGRVDWTRTLAATGWQTDVDSLGMTLDLPPGWRLFALFGADHVEGDWLTAWLLLDLFLLLIFSLAVLRLWGVTAGVVALLAFGLSYHEPGAPRLTWIFLLMPLALLRVVPEGAGRRFVNAWRFLAAALLLLFLVPFAARQIQSALYPQLEVRGVNYSAARSFWAPGVIRPRAAQQVQDTSAWQDLTKRREQYQLRDLGLQMDSVRAQYTSNLAYDPKSQIQTGPAAPEWSWNRVHCSWDGPVTASQQIRPILIPLQLHRLLTVLRLVLLLALLAILFGVTRVRPRVTSAGAGVIVVLMTMLVFPKVASAQFPDPLTLESLRQRLLEKPDVFPRAAEIAAVELVLDEDRVTMKAEVHAAIEVAVPLPGRLPAWSPLSVQLDAQRDTVLCRRDGYLWVVVPPGVHQITVEGLLPAATEWEWTYPLKPRRVTVDAADWNVTGIGPNGIPEQQVFFARKRQATDREAAYDRKDFNAVVVVDRYLEVGLIWQARTEVTRLSSPGKAISLQLPLLAGERVLTSDVVVRDRVIEVRLGAGQTKFVWESELPIGEAIFLSAVQTDEWVERWHLVTSPVWNLTQEGLSPVFEAPEANLIPVWHPWPGERVALQFSKPVGVAGETITVQRVQHNIELGRREHKSKLSINVECSLAEDLAIDLDADADISSLTIDNQKVPVRRDGAQLIVPLHPGKQAVEVNWRTTESPKMVVGAGQVSLSVESANITTVMRVPESRWVLWAEGPLRGPAVRFWVILLCALLAALVLGILPNSPLRGREWMLLAVGLTQVNILAALIVVGWFFLLAWRGQRDPDKVRWWRFNLMQMFLVVLTLVVLGILIVVVREGLLGDPEMFIIGNGSSRRTLNWFQPRVAGQLPEPVLFSISVWYYRLLMLAWALWLAAALIRWLQWGWTQFASGAGWKKMPPWKRKKATAADAT